jgi:hypothetical protein
MRPLPSQEVLLALLYYDPATGDLWWKPRPRDMCASDREWKRWNTRHAGTAAFTSIDTHGYKHGSVLGVLYMAHRVIWKMRVGTDPPADIDHDNGVRADNRWRNLKSATRHQNCLNQKMRCTNKSGVMGVHWDKASRKWIAQIRGGGRNRYLGSFDDLDAARVARSQAEKKLGFHPNHGRAQ